ncbi:MAG: hypothetical protein K9K65_12815 [Desulfarculaceae bacterium]|nr:hypothetical protein [Desulfarculaceae bacterium]MCF8098714.1 hypothetical protein [Desulfarculaceae bacterium]MCF8123944.1 hypothetical protein [Desulfarculaceae bacterium]
MKGSIYTSERCPLCGGKLRHDENRGGLFCADHPEIRAQHSFRVIFDRQIKRRFRSYPEAIRFLTGLRFLEDQGSLDPRDFQGSNPLSFEVQASRWLQVKEKEVKHNTYRDLRLTMHRAIDAWGQRNVKSIGYAEIEDFLYALEVSDKTRANARAHLHQFFSWMSRRENIPMPDMPEIKYELGWRNIVDLESQSAILDELYRQTWEFNPRIWIGIRWLSTYVAIRPGELRNLRERDIGINGFFVIPSPKEKKPKLVPMLEEDLELYHSLPQGLPDLYFFRHLKGNGAAAPGSRFSKDYLYRWWKRACKALGIEGVDLYGGTRHSTASALGQHFSKEELRDHGTMHSTNKAFERYMQYQAAPSRKIYEKARELASGGKAKVIKLEKAKDGE